MPYIEIPGEIPHEMRVGYVLAREARKRNLELNDIAQKAQRGGGYFRRIARGDAAQMREYDIRRACQALDLSMSTFYKLVEEVNLDELRLLLGPTSILWAGGTANQKNVKALAAAARSRNGKK